MHHHPQKPKPSVGAPMSLLVPSLLKISGINTDTAMQSGLPQSATHCVAVTLSHIGQALVMQGFPPWSATSRKPMRERMPLSTAMLTCTLRSEHMHRSSQPPCRLIEDRRNVTGVIQPEFWTSSSVLVFNF
jgi:hypothetical protein